MAILSRESDCETFWIVEIRLYRVIILFGERLTVCALPRTVVGSKAGWEPRFRDFTPSFVRCTMLDRDLHRFFFFFTRNTPARKEHLRQRPPERICSTFTDVIHGALEQASIYVYRSVEKRRERDRDTRRCTSGCWYKCVVCALCSKSSGIRPERDKSAHAIENTSPRFRKKGCDKRITCRSSVRRSCERRCLCRGKLCFEYYDETFKPPILLFV